MNFQNGPPGSSLERRRRPSLPEHPQKSTHHQDHTGKNDQQAAAPATAPWAARSSRLKKAAAS
jgi:hypothetical protein